MSIINESIMTLSGMEYYEGKNKDRLKNELAKKVPTTRKINSKALTSDITLSASDVGLGNVGNFKAVSTVASQGLTDTEKSNARANIGAQPSGNYASASHTHDDRYYTESEINTKLNGKANSSHTHGNGDITSLDAGKITSGTISIDRLPQGALERLIIVADDTARFKLTSKTVQKGDTVKVTATSKMYYVVDESKLSTEEGYEVYTAGSATSVPWSGVTGKPSTYTPSSHTHDDRYYTESEIDSKLSGKANSSHTHTKSQITDFPKSMPANGGNASTVNGHTVKSDVPENAKFTDTNSWRPLGNTADTACAGNDSRLSNARPASDVSAWAKASTKPSYTKSEVGLGNVDNTADSAKSVKYATSAGSASSASKATSVVDYGATGKTIQIGYSGDGISGDKIKFIAGYTTGNGSDVNAKIKDISKDALKSWLGLGSLAYSSATIPTIPSSLPANGGNSATVNGHTVNSNVPANAKFTDTTYSNFVKSGSGAKNGLVPAPSTTAGTTKYLREDGTWQTPPNTNTWIAFKGATSSAAGTAGYVPAPAKGEQTKFFRADGTWQTVPAGGNKTAYQKTEPTGQSNNDEWLKEY